jgi:hypothetical protein
MQAQTTAIGQKTQIFNPYINHILFTFKFLTIMAKGIGLIGNFKGKVGNTVGYKLTASNNGQTQGIRVYQPIVKNPKTAAQAEQRAKLLAVNATYRALKMVIDRGNEGLPYGNKSRLAWLKSALKAEVMPWYEKGSIPSMPVGCRLTKGSLASVGYTGEGDTLTISVANLADSTDISTIGKLSTALLAGITTLKEGDQLTIVGMYAGDNGNITEVKSIVLDSTSTVAQDFFTVGDNQVTHMYNDGIAGYSVIVSREGGNGEHLRSNESLVIPNSIKESAPYDADSKAAAIASYRASAASNSDWAEESIQ